MNYLPTTSSLISWKATGLFVGTFAMLLLMSLPAEAASTLLNAVCLPFRVLLGDFGRGLATTVVAFFGIQAMLGRVQWSQALLVAAGIGILYGAAALVAQVNAGTGCDTTAVVI